MQNYPNIQEFEGSFYNYFSEADILEEFESLKHGKNLHLDQESTIEEIFLQDPSQEGIDWSFVASMEKVCAVNILSFSSLGGKLFEYLRLDHLEGIEFTFYSFDKNETILLFGAISWTKNLKSLSLSICAFVENPVLSDGIEMEIEFEQWESEEKGGMRIFILKSSTN